MNVRTETQIDFDPSADFASRMKSLRTFLTTLWVALCGVALLLLLTLPGCGDMDDPYFGYEVREGYDCGFSNTTDCFAPMGIQRYECYETDRPGVWRVCTDVDGSLFFTAYPVGSVLRPAD